MERTPNQDNSLDCDPELTFPNLHTKPTEFLLNFSYTGTHFSSSRSCPLELLIAWSLSTCVFLTYSGSVPPLSMRILIFDLRCHICWCKIWKNTSSGTSLSPPRYSNWAAILFLIAINNGRGCALKLSTLRSRSREYSRQPIRHALPVGHPTSSTSTHKRWSPALMCSSSLSFIDRRRFFSFDCRWCALPSPPSSSAVRQRRRTFSRSPAGSTLFWAIHRNMLTSWSSSSLRSSLQCPPPSYSSSMFTDVSSESISQARIVSCMFCDNKMSSSSWLFL